MVNSNKTKVFLLRLLSVMAAIYLLQCGIALWLTFVPLCSRTISPAGVHIFVFREIRGTHWVPFVGLAQIIADRQGYGVEFCWNGLCKWEGYDMFSDVSFSQLAAETDGKSCRVFVENATIVKFP